MSAAQEEATNTLDHRNNVTLHTSWTVELAPRIGHGGSSLLHPDIIIYMIQRDSERESCQFGFVKTYTSVFNSAYCVCMLMTSRVANVRFASVY